MVRTNRIRGVAVVALGAALGMPQFVGAQAVGAQAEGGCGDSYTVRSGDTLAAIAERCEISVEAILEANEQIGDPNAISIGLELAMPGSEPGAQEESAASGAGGVIGTPGADDVLAAPVPDEKPAAHAAVKEPASPVPDEKTVADEQSAGPVPAETPSALTGEGPAALVPDEEPSAAGAGEEDEAIAAEAPEAPAYDPPPGAETAPGGIYHVQDGDSFASIATTLGIDLLDLLDANEDIDPYALDIGQEIRLPAAEPGPVDGAPSAENARGPAPGESVGESTPPAPPVLGGAEPLPPPMVEDAGSPIALEGRVQTGAECPVLETADGEIYSLVSDSFSFTPGEYVAIEGEPVEMSLCMQGAATVRVSSMKQVPAPRGG